MLEDLVVWYLFLGGAGSGLLFATAVLESLSSPLRAGEGDGRAWRCLPLVYGRFFAPAYGMGLAAVVLGMVCLFLDLGRSDRALSLLYSPASSWITLGVFALLALIGFAAVLFASWHVGVRHVPRRLEVVVRVGCILAAFAVMAYTGLFLFSMPAVPLWNSWWLPVLFVASAASTGLALLVCMTVLSGSGGEFASTLRRIQRMDAAVMVGELIAVALFLVSGLMGDETARQSTERLVRGDLAPLLWGLVVAGGLIAPLTCDLLNRKGYAGIAVIAGVMVLTGGFFLRWCISEAGAHPDVVTSFMLALGIQ